MKRSGSSLKWIVPLVGLLVLAGWWLATPKLDGAQKDNPLAARFSDLGIISQQGLMPEADMRFFDLNRHQHRISDYKGKVVLLNLWATWCPDCRREMPTLQRLQNKLGTKDFVVVALDLKETQKAVEKFIKQEGFNFQVLLDFQGVMGRALRVRSIPTTYIIGRNGELIGKILGPRDWDKKEFVSLMRNLIGKDESQTSSENQKPLTNQK